MDKKAIELFSGVGGVTQSLKTHFNIICSIEMDPVISRSYSANHGSEHLLVTDITKVENTWWENIKKEHGEIELLVSTPPCQGFSVYNRKKDKEKDSRNDLIFQTIRVSNIISPQFILFENVRGILKHSYFKRFISELQNLDIKGNKVDSKLPSYQIQFSVVNAVDYSVPQNRKRLILIAKKIDEFPSEESIIKINAKGQQISGFHNIWPQVQKQVTLLEHLKPYNLPFLRAGERDPEDALHTSMNLSLINLKRLAMTPANGGTRESWEADLQLPCQQKNQKSFKDVYGRMDYSKVAPTITTGCVTLSKGRFGHPEENRAISLREAALIQTFPITYKFHGDLHSDVNLGSKNNIAKQIGNAVPVKLASAFIKEICQSIDTERMILSNKKAVDI